MIFGSFGSVQAPEAGLCLSFSSFNKLPARKEGYPLWRMQQNEFRWLNLSGLKLGSGTVVSLIFFECQYSSILLMSSSTKFFFEVQYQISNFRDMKAQKTCTSPRFPNAMQTRVIDSPRMEHQSIAVSNFSWRPRQCCHSTLS